MIFRFLFARYFTVQITVPWLDHERFVHENFKTAKRISKVKFPDIDISNVPFTGDQCMMMERPMQHTILKNTGDSTKNQISLINFNDSFTIADLVRSGYKIVTQFDKKSEYIITTEKNRIFENFKISNLSFFDQKRPIFIKSSVYKLCHKHTQIWLNFITKILLPTMIFIVLLRLFVCNFIPLNIKPIHADSFAIWFITGSGRNLTPMNISMITKEPRIRQKINNFVQMNKSSPKDDYVSTINISSSPTIYNNYKIVIRRVCKGVYQVTVMRFEIKNETIDYKTSVSGSVLRLDDRDLPQNIDAELIFHKNEYPNVRYKFDVDSNPCELDISTNSTKGVPFGVQSVEVYRINCLHMSIFKEGIKMQPSYEQFVSLMKLIHVRLDYKCTCVFSLEDNVLTTIARYCVPELNE